MNIKNKRDKICVIKRKFKFKDYKKCFKASQIENTANHLEKKEIDFACLKEDKKEFTKNRLITKTQQRFKFERDNVSTKEINKIASSSNDDKRMQLIDLIETYVSGSSKYLICKKEKK